MRFNRRLKVYVGMSGGVDSSVTAALLKQQGYHVTGVYMKNWSQDIGGFVCPWQEDFNDAKRVAVTLGIDFKMYDFEKEYKHKVVDYMLKEYKAGGTPNPDIMCNSEIKFKLFLETAVEDGADMVSTGHYARVKNGQLWAGLDKNKDQSYFLYRVTEEALNKTIFPLGELTKTQVRAIAKKLGLHTAKKKDSQGICFVGNVGIKEFLQNYISTKPGKIIDHAGKVVGQHDGAISYTIGQRHGLWAEGRRLPAGRQGLPYYITGKNMKKNEVYVTNNLDDTKLWHNKISLTNLHWIDEPPQTGKIYLVRTRYRAPLIECTIEKPGKNSLLVKLSEQVRAITPGQSAVIYENERVVGGGIVTPYLL